MRALVLTAALAATPALAQPGSQEQPLSVLTPAADGGLRHLQSGLVCPARIGEAERVAAKPLHAFGLDFACGYNTERAAVTLYITHGLPLQQSFEIAKQAIVQNPALGGVRPRADGPIELGGVTWLSAEYATGRGQRTEVWLAERHGWVVKYRATYLPDDAEQVRGILTRLTEAVQASAGAHLDLCAKAAAPARPGRAVKTKSGAAPDPAMLVTLMASGAAATAQGGKPITYCADEPVADGDRGFFLWRGVTADGQDAHADRLTAMTIGEPPKLDTSLDAVGNAVAGELAGGRAPQRWVATMNDGKTTTIYGVYEGRPSAKALLPLANALLDGKAQPLGSVSVDGKTVSIGLPTR